MSSKATAISKEELQDIMTEVECSLVNLEFAETLVTEASYDVAHVFSKDGDPVIDHLEELNLIRRTPFIRNFLYMALDYIHDMQEELKELVEKVYEERIREKK